MKPISPDMLEVLTDFENRPRTYWECTGREKQLFQFLKKRGLADINPETDTIYVTSGGGKDVIAGTAKECAYCQDTACVYNEQVVMVIGVYGDTRFIEGTAFTASVPYTALSPIKSETV